MPFYAKDWRSPGEVWIKTEDGWEKQKILECRQLSHETRNLIRSVDNDKENCSLDEDKLQGYVAVPPYCQITLKCTREVAGFNGLSDALRRLDFRSAVHDQRRFPYTAKLLELLLSQQRIVTLSGCAQKSVLNVLEEIAVQAHASQQNGHVLSKLLSDLRRIVRGNSWWGQPLGSSQLWGHHVQTIDRIDAIASQPLEETVPDDSKPKFEDLPEECVREILFRLADHNDLFSAAEVHGGIRKLTAEQRLWKRLCRYHFKPLQINFMLNAIKKERENNCNLNNGKTNRNSRALHPYLNNSNGNSNNNNGTSRKSPVRGHQHETDPFDKNETSELNSTWEFLDNGRAEDSTRGRVSVAFHEHLNRNRDNLMSHQEEEQQQHPTNRFISFQDVRNHFDLQRSESVDNNAAPHRRNASASNKKKNGEPNPTLETDWEDLYFRLRRLFGLREEYAEVLYLCRKCRSLFWKSFGHPCVVNQPQNKDPDPKLFVPVPPHEFLEYFSL